MPEVLGTDTSINTVYGTCADVTGAPLSVPISATPVLNSEVLFKQHSGFSCHIGILTLQPFISPTRRYWLNWVVKKLLCHKPCLWMKTSYSICSSYSLQVKTCYMPVQEPEREITVHTHRPPSECFIVYRTKNVMYYLTIKSGVS